MTIPATTVAVSGLRFSAIYALSGRVEEARQRASAIAIEQTIEFPLDLIADDDIRAHVVGRIETIDELGSERALVRISYALETSGSELPQLLNVLFGNASLLPGVRLMSIDLPRELLARFRGPRFGDAGLRRLFDAPDRPLVATALKPMGLSSAALAAMARTLALAGLDIIKDDHGLADQPFAPYLERVRACAAAVRQANREVGSRSIYVPAINAPAGQVVSRARAAKEAGAGGLLVLPGLSGFDTMRALAEDDALDLPIMAHPAFLGANVVSDELGIEHGTLFGTMMRLAGADISIFPGYGGRFRFDQSACRSIVEAARAPLGAIAATMPTPAGGITLDRIDEVIGFYGRNIVLLIGGDLHRGDLLHNARRMRSAVETGSAGAT